MNIRHPLPISSNILFTITGILCLSSGVIYAKDVLVGSIVTRQQRIPLDRIDHSNWSALLQKFVNDRGQVDYQGWKADKEASKQIDTYLKLLSAGDLRQNSSSEAKLAYWINAYNAVTIKGILREYPTTSIRNHTATLWGYNIWEDLKLQVSDQQVSLDSMEHKILRPMGEPRIHFAIVCASIGCPRLLNEAYTKEQLHEQLTRNAKDFFTHTQNFRVDADGKTVYLSSILKWFIEDFGNSKSATLKKIAPWLPNDEARRATEVSGVRVEYLDYDWNLNKQ